MDAARLIGVGDSQGNPKEIPFGKSLSRNSTRSVHSHDEDLDFLERMRGGTPLQERPLRDDMPRMVELDSSRLDFPLREAVYVAPTSRLEEHMFGKTLSSPFHADVNQEQRRRSVLRFLSDFDEEPSASNADGDRDVDGDLGVEAPREEDVPFGKTFSRTSAMSSEAPLFDKRCSTRSIMTDYGEGYNHVPRRAAVTAAAAEQHEDFQDIPFGKTLSRNSNRNLRSVLLDAPEPDVDQPFGLFGGRLTDSDDEREFVSPVVSHDGFGSGRGPSSPVFAAAFLEGQKQPEKPLLPGLPARGSPAGGPSYGSAGSPAASQFGPPHWLGAPPPQQQVGLSPTWQGNCQESNHTWPEMQRLRQREQLRGDVSPWEAGVGSPMGMQSNGPPQFTPPGYPPGMNFGGGGASPLHQQQIPHPSVIPPYVNQPGSGMSPMSPGAANISRQCNGFGGAGFEARDNMMPHKVPQREQRQQPLQQHNLQQLQYMQHQQQLEMERLHMHQQFERKLQQRQPWPQQHWQQLPSQHQQPSQPQELHQNSDQASLDQRSRTTVMVRNLPVGFSRDMLVEMLNVNGFRARFDFVYMPINFRTKTTFGYAFVNFVSEAEAHRTRVVFEGFKDWGVDTDKICEVSWSDMHQGLHAHVERYRSSPVMHESVPDEYKPAMFSNGVRVPFPPPTKKIRLPRIRRLSDSGVPGEDDEFADGSPAQDVPWGHHRSV